jgi:hypothetical protein
MDEKKDIEQAFDYISLANTLKWPLMILIIIFIFRKPLVDLINRVTKVGYGNKSLEAKQQAIATEKKREEVSHIDRVVGLFRPETIDTFKDAVANETEVETLKTQEEKIERLTNYGCLLYIMRHFDIVYNNIFGSQIRILEYINSHAEQSRESVKFFYDNAKKNNPKFYENYSYEQYLDFIFSYNLLEDRDNILNITVLGIDFLKYLIESNKGVNKRN